MSTGVDAVPLAPRWHGAELAGVHAGATAVARVRVANAGRATWHTLGRNGLRLAYHWLDPLGNPVVWDGARTALPQTVVPGDSVEVAVEVVAPRPPGRYVLRFDLVEEHRFWLEELGCDTLDVPLDVLPRITRRSLGVLVHGGADSETEEALAAQEEPLAGADAEAEAVAHLVAGAVPPPDWSRRILDAHAEGWAAVGPAVVPGDGWIAGRRERRALAPWAPGGRNPRLAAPLLLPSLLAGMAPGDHLGLPAYHGDEGLFEGRVAVRLPRRSGRRPT